MIPTEILCHIFSFLSYSELYRIRSVCQEWKHQSEYSFYLTFRREQQTLSVCVGQQVVKMVPADYDTDNQVIEFHTAADSANIDTTDSDLRARLIFSEWKNDTETNANILKHLDLAEQAQALFHLNYNPSLEQLYELPICTAGTQTRYAGDRGVIIAFEYINKSPDRAAEIYVKSVHTNLSWLLSGINPNVVIQPLYESKYQRLLYDLDINGFKPTRPYSESICRCLMENTGKLVLEFNKEAEEGAIATRRLYRIQNILTENGVDPRVVWKYTFTKNYIYRSMYSNMNLNDVAKAILESEKKWATQKRDLLCKVNKEKV
ncbi:hypothetical protein K501DRAFT_261421 [Backusella circina FSU 941]|nr:hypothetical protein K501DRAFT_261421 [Backusella circina FSU 941]